MVVAWLALVLAVVALTIALGTSLGRNGDREDEWHYRDQVGEALNQLDERVKKVEPDAPETEDDGRGS